MRADGRESKFAHRHILGMRADSTTYDEAVQTVLEWARERAGRYVCVASVNNVMEAHRDGSFLLAMNSADLVTTDGVPLVWGLRLLGLRGASRVYGPDLTERLLAAAERFGTPVGFYGGTPGSLGRLLDAVAKRWPQLEVRYAFPPPFRVLSGDEEHGVLTSIRSSGARILFVGLGCPKQELWMHRHSDLEVVQLGVGAAFDFLAGLKPQAPGWMQRIGLEWLFRLLSEPRRLWKRYLRNNPQFAVLFGAQLIRDRTKRLRAGPSRGGKRT